MVISNLVKHFSITKIYVGRLLFKLFAMKYVYSLIPAGEITKMIVNFFLLKY